METQPRNGKGRFREKERTASHVLRSTKSKDEIIRMIQTLKGLVPETKEFDELYNGLEELKHVFVT